MARANNTVDRLGDLNAEIKRLQGEAATLKEALAKRSATVHIGNHFKATVVFSESKTTAWKKIALDLGANGQRITANTRTFPVTSVRVTELKEV